MFRWLPLLLLPIGGYAFFALTTNISLPGGWVFHAVEDGQTVIDRLQHPALTFGVGQDKDPLTFTKGDLFVLISIAALAVELFRAYVADSTAWTNHLFSLAITLASPFLIAFYPAYFLTSTFVILMLFALLDTLIGWTLHSRLNDVGLDEEIEEKTRRRSRKPVSQPQH